MKIAAPKGTRDILPEESGLWREVERVFRETCELFQFGELRLPTFEHTEIFQRGVGDTTDIVSKEMYTFDDKAGRSMTLRPEGTAGAVRAFIENGMASRPFPVKLYYILNLFRYENVQKGRYREFHQLGVEAFGSASPELDAEIISLLDLFFKRLGLKHTSLHLNSLGTEDSRAQYTLALKDYFKPHLSSLCKDCQSRYETNPLRILDCKVPHDQEIAAAAPLMFDYLNTEDRAHFDRICTLLDAWSIPYTVDKRIVRGLDYYTRTVFEFVSENVGTQGTICGGGRYDKLVEVLGGPAVPAVGFALGQERLLLEMAAQGIALEAAKPVGVYIASLDEASLEFAATLALQLRKKGYAAAFDVVGRSLKAQMKYAGKSDYDFSLVLGSNEVEALEARLRRMADGEEKTVRLDDLTAFEAYLRGENE